jgi:hypothetical protein
VQFGGMIAFGHPAEYPNEWWVQPAGLRAVGGSR